MLPDPLNETAKKKTTNKEKTTTTGPMHARPRVSWDMTVHDPAHHLGLSATLQGSGKQK